MFHYTVRHVGMYDDAAYWNQPCNFTGIVLTVRGMQLNRFNGIEYPAEIPHLALFVKEYPLEFRFGANRENWTAILDGFGAQVTSPGFVDWHDGQQFISIPRFLALPQSRVAEFRDKFSTMRRLTLSPTPINRLTLNAMIAGVLEYILVHADTGGTSSPAMQLKQRIDADKQFRLSVTDLSAAIGYSADHLRRMFIAEFNKSPQTYRNERRLALASEAIIYTTLSIKEISAQLGFEFMSAFSSFYKHHTGITPRDAVRQYRLNPTH